MHYHNEYNSTLFHNSIPVIGTFILILLLVLYFYGAFKIARKWAFYKTVAFTIGLLLFWICLFGPLSFYQLAHIQFTAHMMNHFLIGMVSPLLLVLATPLTLLLKALPTRHARIVVKLLKSNFSTLLVNPIFIGILNIGGLWAIYTTSIYHWMHENAWLFLFIHVHVFMTSYLFTLSIVSNELYFQRVSIQLRSAILFLYIASHSILAKYLYVHPPATVSLSDAEQGSMFMYYSGDFLHVFIIFLLARQWYKKRQTMVPIKKYV